MAVCLESYRNPVKQHHGGNFLELSDFKKDVLLEALFILNTSGHAEGWIDMINLVPKSKSLTSDKKTTELSTMTLLKIKLVLQAQLHE